MITKVGSDMGQGRTDLSRAWILREAEASLRRLRIETIDLYLAHWPDPTGRRPRRRSAPSRP